MRKLSRDASAAVVGSGPNAMVASILLAQAGMEVTVLEKASRLGGGVRTAELTLPGFQHDICSSVYPLAVASPVLQSLSLAETGLAWVHPPLPLAHPFADGSAVCLHTDLEDTARQLDGDGQAWQTLMAPVVEHWDQLAPAVLGPLRLPPARGWMRRFGWSALQSCTRLCQTRLQTERAQALFTGLAAHGMVRLDAWASAAFGLVLGGTAHLRGWPMVRGGAQVLTRALQQQGARWGVQYHTGCPVNHWQELAGYGIKMLDLGPYQVAQLAASELAPPELRRLRAYRYGLGVCKVDYALREPVPWQAPACRRAGTVHLGGSAPQMRQSLDQVWHGEPAARPFVIAVQPSLFDPSRAPAGQHVLWAYCHVPHGWHQDASSSIEAQIERYAPGFRDIVLGRHVMHAGDWPRYNPNFVGGDINGGIQDLRQMWRRPVSVRNPYRLSVPGLYLCSSSTPPGGGVHGMCGFHAAQAALTDWRGK